MHQVHQSTFSFTFKYIFSPRCCGVFDLSILEVEITEETGPTPHTGDALFPSPLLTECTSLV